MELQARVAANAVDLEQPYLFVTRVDRVEFNYSHRWLDGKSYDKPSTKIYVVNLGRTPAVLSFSKIALVFDYMPSRKPDPFWTHHGLHQDIIVVDRSDEHSIVVTGSSYESSMPKSDYFKMQEAIVYGALIYYDVFGNQIETTFGFSAEGLNSDFKRINSRWYNYRKSHPKSDRKTTDVPPDAFGT